MQNLIKIWLIALFIKLIISALIPLSSDEAYYWVWSQNMQLSYYDHPPAVAWLFYLGRIFDGFHQAIRWPSVILGHFSFLVWFYILKNYFSVEKIRWWFLLASFSPLFGLGSMAVTPDLPVVFFWSLSILFFIRALESNKSLYFSLLGVALGLGFCSKYHIVLFVFIVFIFLFLERKQIQYTKKYILLTVFWGFIFSLPVIIWNYQHDFISFKFQLKHGLGADRWKAWWAYTYPFGQIFSIFPIIFYYAIRSRVENRLRFLYYFAWGPLLFFLLSSFKGKVEVNWPIIAYPAVFALAVYKLKNSRPILITNFTWIFLVILLSSNFFYPWMKDLPDKLTEPFRYKQIIEASKKYSPSYASTYQMASYMWYKTKSPYYKLKDIGRRDFFDGLAESTPKSTPFYMFTEEDMEIPAWIIESGIKVKEIEKVGIFKVWEFSR